MYVLLAADDISSQRERRISQHWRTVAVQTVSHWTLLEPHIGRVRRHCATVCCHTSARKYILTTRYCSGPHYASCPSVRPSARLSVCFSVLYGLLTRQRKSIKEQKEWCDRQRCFAVFSLFQFSLVFSYRYFRPFYFFLSQVSYLSHNRLFFLFWFFVCFFSSI